jgi:hypothetical protein
MQKSLTTGQAALYCTVNPAKRMRLITATCEAARGQRAYEYWISVYGVYKSLRMLTDVSSVTL